MSQKEEFFDCIDEALSDQVEKNLDNEQKIRKNSENIIESPGD